MCLVQDMLLYCEPCNMAAVSSRQVDFIYDLGTMSGFMGEHVMDILINMEEEDVLIETKSKFMKEKEYICQCHTYQVLSCKRR